MKFTTLTVLAFLSGAAAFVGPSNVQNRVGVGAKNANLSLKQKIQTAQTVLFMADGPTPKKSKKEQLIEEINAKSLEAEARRQALEAELQAAEAERLRLLKEAERAAKLPDARPIDFGAAGGSVPLVAGGIAAAVGARQALQGRAEMQEEFKRKQQIAKAAAEQDAKNRAAAEARKQSLQNAVSFICTVFIFSHT